MSKKKVKTPKSKHKHIYEDCLFKYEKHNTITNKKDIVYVKGCICKICGKINDVHYFETEPIETETGTHWRLISDYKKILEKYKDLPIYEVDTDGKLFIKGSVTFNDC